MGFFDRLFAPRDSSQKLVIDAAAPVDEGEAIDFILRVGPGMGKELYVKILGENTSSPDKKEHVEADIDTPSTGEFLIHIKGRITLEKFGSKDACEDALLNEAKRILSGVSAIKNGRDVRSCGDILSTNIRVWTNRPLNYQLLFGMSDKVVDQKL